MYTLFVLEIQEAWAGGTVVLAAEDEADIVNVIVEDLRLNGRYNQTYSVGEPTRTYWDASNSHLMKNGAHWRSSDLGASPEGITPDCVIKYGQDIPYEHLETTLNIVASFPNAAPERKIYSSTYHSG
jgi:hypothetical protein